MEFEEPIRILSDIHYGHPATLVESPDQLLPLVSGARTVIFNGDTVETRFKEDRDKGASDLETIAQVCRQAGSTPIFLNGNHDPAISEINHADLAGGSLLVTHGDMLFHDISPWSPEARLLGDSHTKALSELEGDALYDFEQRLSASKRASLALELHRPPFPRGRLARLVTYIEECWPPWRPFQIIRVWVRTPGRAVALARVFRPRARFIAIGHTHFAGIWRKGPRCVINTGSFVPGSGCRLIDLEGKQLIVRAIRRSGEGFRPGREIARFDTTPLAEGED